MKVYVVSMLNAFVLIVFGLWGYLGSRTPSSTALIPVFAGILLLSFVWGVKNSNRIIAHLAVVITFVLILAFIKPLTGAIGRGDNGAVIRVAIMMISGIVSMVYFIRSFIAVRKAREATNK
jgi:hypothetical protein